MKIKVDEIFNIVAKYGDDGCFVIQAELAFSESQAIDIVNKLLELYDKEWFLSIMQSNIVTSNQKDIIEWNRLMNTSRLK